MHISNFGSGVENEAVDWQDEDFHFPKAMFLGYLEIYGSLLSEGSQSLHLD